MYRLFRFINFLAIFSSVFFFNTYSSSFIKTAFLKTFRPLYTKKSLKPCSSILSDHIKKELYFQNLNSSIPDQNNKVKYKGHSNRYKNNKNNYKNQSLSCNQKEDEPKPQPLNTHIQTKSPENDPENDDETTLLSLKNKNNQQKDNGSSDTYKRFTPLDNFMINKPAPLPVNPFPTHSNSLFIMILEVFFSTFS